MRTRQGNRPSPGFTLIEMIISTALMSLILGSAYLCLRAGLLGQKMVDVRADVSQTARVALALMAADLRAACPLSADFEFIGMQRMLGDVEADNLDFATHNYTPRGPEEGDWCEISYFLEKNPETGRYSLWRRRDPSPGSDPLDGGMREEIAEGLRGLRFEYYDGYEWYDDWGEINPPPRDELSLLLQGNLFGMPEAVRITLWFEPDAGANRAASNEENGELSEPSLVFQTVVRLNLAASSWPAASSGASQGASAASTGPSTPTPGGGN
jgi:prepilin-type N-terminal cleavage/methylation domain-containing protein